MKRTLPLFAAPLFAAFALAACATPINGPIVGGGPIRGDGMAMLGQPTRVGAWVVTPQAVVEDSRCPINARCVWAGRAIVRTRIDGAGWRETRNLTLGQPQSVRMTTIALTSVEPGKMAGEQAPPAPYVFGFEGGR